MSEKDFEAYLLQKFKRQTEFNYKEHFMHFWPFIGRMILSCVAGGLVGALIQKTVKHLQGTRSPIFSAPSSY
jgi:hypothetical protein